MNNILVEVSNLSSKSKKKYIYKDINFKVSDGEVIGLLGHNGAGKSTMLRNIANLEIPQIGEVFINGQKNDINQLNKNIILIPDDIILFKNLSIKQNFEIVSANHKFDQVFYKEYMNKIKLKDDDIINQLSKGNQEIAQLIMFLALDVKVVMLDEPFSAIDIFRREIIIKMLIDISLKKDKCIIITTHLINEIEGVLTRIVYLHETEIIFDQEMDQIRQEADTLFIYLKKYFNDEVKL